MVEEIYPLPPHRLLHITRELDAKNAPLPSIVLRFQLLTNHYERCWKYYCLPNGWANFGVTSEEELHLSRKLFWGIFESLAHKVRNKPFRITNSVLFSYTGHLHY